MHAFVAKIDHFRQEAGFAAFFSLLRSAGTMNNEYFFFRLFSPHPSFFSCETETLQLTTVVTVELMFASALGRNQRILRGDPGRGLHTIFLSLLTF